MKKMLILSATLAAVTVFGEQTNAMQQRSSASNETLLLRDERVLKKTGGFIEINESGPVIELIDARKEPGGGVEKVATTFHAVAKLPIRSERVTLGPRDGLNFAQEWIKRGNSAMVILVAQMGMIPVWTVYPEERIALINVDRLAQGVDKDALEIRVIKELWRSIGFLGGAGYSMQDDCVMQPIFSIKELDETRWQAMQPVNYMKMTKMFNKLQVKRGRKVPYRIACMEGWANPPTNSYQKVIWEEVKAIKKKAPAEEEKK